MITPTPWETALAAVKRQRAAEAFATAQEYDQRAATTSGRSRAVWRALARRCRAIGLGLRLEAARLDPPLPPPRIRAGYRCPVCLGARAPRRRLCDRCGETHGWCASCRTVHTLDRFPPPTPSARRHGARHDPQCYLGERREKRARRGAPPCARCGGEREGGPRLCATCRTGWGVCRDCGVQPLAAFSAASPTHARRGMLHAPRCKACHAAYMRERKRAKREEQRHG